ncbi:hypothetical protein KUCAC02_029368 [Chaenocephalus aceratus]|uniref:Uncharacterized protein n=1 Tax=Chaenocephalus aceratus TaxID=36190 RepID=A0ACB9X6M9_CHAAC|nr:hypothetical protein KUCAC02_029368 [Chaenocephalus aceratus]
MENFWIHQVEKLEEDQAKQEQAEHPAGDEKLNEVSVCNVSNVSLFICSELSPTCTPLSDTLPCLGLVETLHLRVQLRSVAVWYLHGETSPPQLLRCSPGSDSPSPPGAESSSRLLLQDDSFQSSPSSKETKRSLASFPTYVEGECFISVANSGVRVGGILKKMRLPGPCDPEDLIDGIIFAANYLGSTQLLSDKTPSKNIRMMQAQEAVSRIKVNTHTHTHTTHWSLPYVCQAQSSLLCVAKSQTVAF